MIDRPALATQQGRYTTVSVTAVVTREFHDPLEQPRLVAGYMPLPPLRAAMLTQHLASPTLRRAVASE